MNKQKLTQFQKLFERSLQDQILYDLTPIEIFESMIYSLQSGGKRLRPTLLLATLWVLDVNKLSHGISSALALEYIHTYSLIHDDLPAMDDDDYRRGALTSHLKFDEATAILTGDALLTDAFKLIAVDDQLAVDQKVELIAKLSEAAGPRGMVVGQVFDMRAEGKTISLQELQHMHALKTGELFKFAVRAAGIIGRATEVERDYLDDFAVYFGRGFQIHNDLMDAIGDQAQTGKNPAQDVANQKATYISLLDVDGSIKELQMDSKKARQVLDELSAISDKDFSLLHAFIDYLQLPTEGVHHGERTGR